jgi:hypothetical protein
MQDYWNDRRGAYPFDASHGERVVPADGDPEAEAYRARLRARERMAANRYWWVRPAGRRLGLGRLLWIGALLALVLIFIKPLAVLATIGLVLLFGFVALLFLAAGTIFLVARFVLGARSPWPRPHGFD